MGRFARNNSPMSQVVGRSRRRVGSLAVGGRYHKLPRGLEDDYLVDRLRPLGCGYGGYVYPATGIRSGQPFAVKTFKLAGANLEQLEDIHGEAEMLLFMDHPHVVRLMDIYDTGDELSFVMERMEGGELYERLLQEQRFPEPQALDATMHMLRAVEYIHTEGVVHRDLKLENFMYDQRAGENSEDFLKLIDFGFSKFVRKSESLNDCLGTLRYLAPEVIARQYSGGSCDMWSLGVIVYTLLCGCMPFDAEGEAACIRLIEKGRYQMKPEVWMGVSETAKDFVRKLLVVDPARRLTVSAALAHPWLWGNKTHVSPQADRAIVDAFARFSRAPRMKQTCMKMMAWTLHLDTRRQLRDLFIHSTLSKAGVIKISELKELVQRHPGFSAEEVETLLHTLVTLDGDDDGDLHYSDFLAAMMAAKPQIYDAALHRTFWHFAQADGQTITSKDLTSLLNGSVDKAEVLAFFKEVDRDQDGKIDALEFVTYLCNGCPEQARSQVNSETERLHLVSRSKNRPYQRSGVLCRIMSLCQGVPLLGRCVR